MLQSGKVCLSVCAMFWQLVHISVQYIPFVRIKHASTQRNAGYAASLLYALGLTCDSLATAGQPCSEDDACVPFVPHEKHRSKPGTDLQLMQN